jgi:two-component system, OmpR family, phosphate regulon sensor histidine kinase PhoR
MASCAGFVCARILLGPQISAWIAVLASSLGGFLWLVWDSWQQQRLAASLRNAQTGQSLVESLPGMWGELLDRVRRLLRVKDQELAASEQRIQDFLAAIQVSPNGVMLLDSDNRIEWCNQTAAHLLGLDSQRDVMQHLTNLVRSPELADYLQTGQYDAPVVFNAPRSTAQRPVRISLQLHTYSDRGDGAGDSRTESRKLLLAHDVTAIEQAEVQRRDFVANVSHEIRTPLTVVSGFIETLQSLPLDEAQRSRYLDLMNEQSKRMQSLVDDLLTLSKLEGAPVPTLETSVDVRETLHSCEQDARALMQSLGSMLKIHLDVPYDGAIILGDYKELRSAMSNLINNAVRYTPAGGSVDISWHLLPDGRGEFMVSDTGPGVAAEHIPRLTERFYRVDRSRSRETGGTGLGLAIVKHVVQRHGGELRISSELGKGSRFGFVLPAARIQHVAVAAHRDSAVAVQ